MNEKQKQSNREADSYIDLMERVQNWCVDENLNSPDDVIAMEIEKIFGIQKQLILDEFNAEYNADYSTWELVMKAYDKQAN